MTTTITKRDALGVSSATFSHDEKYRYDLMRYVGGEAYSRLVFVMLNPSTANEVENDPTVARCVERARRMGYRELVVCNIFALRSTDPRRLVVEPDPVGPENNRFLLDHVRHPGAKVICAWGDWGWIGGRGKLVARMLAQHAPLHVLKLNRDGAPAHPLYLSYDLQPFEWEPI